MGLGRLLAKKPLPALPLSPPKIICYLKIGESTPCEAQDGPEWGAVLPVSV